MYALDDEIETIHLYVVKEQPKQPYTALPLFCAFLCLVGMMAVVWYSAEHPYYAHERITVPAQFLPLKVFTAETPIISTGLKTYPATYAHGFLTFSNGSVIGQSVPAGFTIDGAMTDAAVYVPAATADSFGMSTVSAHLLTSGVNISGLSINDVLGSSLFIRNLSAFTGGRPAYSVSYQLPQDREAAMNTAKAFLAAQTAHMQEFLARPCNEAAFVLQTLVRLSWGCQFAAFKVPAYMHVQAVKLSGKNFLVDVSFVPLPRLMPFR